MEILTLPKEMDQIYFLLEFHTLLVHGVRIPRTVHGIKTPLSNLRVKLRDVKLY